MIRKYRKSFALCLNASALLVSLSSGYSRAFAGSCTGSGGVFLCSGAADAGSDVLQNLSGSPLTVTTSSTGFGINTTGDAFNLISSGGGLTFTDNYMSTITGSEDGIVAINDGNSNLSIITTGTVTGDNNSGGGIGIWADNRTTGNDLNISAATVTGGDDGINAKNSGTGHLWITSSGKITSTGNGALAFGIVADNQGNGSLSITASDTVESKGSGAYAIGIFANNSSNGTDLTISTADVTGGYAGIYTTNHGKGSLSITSSGTVTGKTGFGIVALNTAFNTDLTVSTVNVSGASFGILAQQLGSGALTISSSGTITGGVFGIDALNLYGADSTISVANVSSSTPFGGIRATHAGRGALTITTSGMVSGGAVSFGIAALNAGGQPTNINVGPQSVVQGGIAGVLLDSYGQSSTLNIDGQVRNLSGLPTDSAIIANNSPTTVNLRTGSLVTGTIDLSDENDTVNLAGALNGSVTMNGGNDTFIQVGGATLTGTANGGLGNDTLGFNNMGTVDNTVLGTKYFNFENLGIFGGSTTLAGAWDFSGGNTTIFGGTLSLAGSLKTNAFTINNGGYANIAGILNSSAVTVSGGMDIGGTVNNTGTFIINNGGYAGIAGILNSSSVTVDGIMDIDGTVNADTFTIGRGGFADIAGYLNSRTATVYGGMKLNGSLKTDTLTIASDGLLSGSGRIDGRLINYGTISPGNSVGTLRVNGSASFMPGSIYQAEIRPNGSSDMIDVSGPVSLHGGTVKTALSRGLYANGQNWKIISASGGINGKFDGLSCRIDSETVDLELAYNSKEVMLEIVRTPFASFGITPAGEAVGAGLDEVVPVAGGNMAGFITAMDFGMSRSQIGNVLNALSPELYTSFSAAGLRSIGVFDQATAQHQAELRQGRMLGLTSLTDANTEIHGEWTVWTRALGNWSESDSDAGYLGYNQGLSGVVAGADRQFTDVLRAGFDLGYTDSDLEWNGTEHSGNMQGRHIGLYASAEPGNFFVDTSASYADFTSDADRIITFDGLSAEAESSFDADAWAGRLEGGYNFTINNWLVSPVASLEYARLTQDDLSEHGADFLNLDIDETDADSLASTLGARFSGLIAKGQWQYMPRLDLRWLHQFEDEGTVVTANFIQYTSATFDVTGIAPEADQGVLSLGLTGEYGKNLSVFVNYGVAIADDYSSQLVSGGLSWKF